MMYDDPQAILAELVDEDGARLIPQDDRGPTVRRLIEDGQAFVPMAKPRKIKEPCKCKRRGWRRNARRDFTLRRALALLVGGYDMNVTEASVVLAGECQPLVKDVVKGPLHPGPASAGTIRALWAKCPHKGDWETRAVLVADRPILFGVLAALDEEDAARANLRRKATIFLHNILGINRGTLTS